MAHAVPAAGPAFFARRLPQDARIAPCAGPSLAPEDREEALRPRPWFWPLYGLLLLMAAWAGTEFVSSYFVPSFPASDLRPVSAEAVRSNLERAFVETPDLIPIYNDWGMRDRPRSFDRPPGVKLRAVMVGDSFVEGFFVRAPLPAHMEKQWSARGRTDMEAINFGVLGTGPQQYYYRIRDVALPLRPDVIMVVVYAGNDFIATPFDPKAIPPVIDELPLPSLLGALAPRTTWLTVNRLGLSEVARGNRGAPGELAMINGWVQGPPAERLAHISRYVHDVYQPTIDPNAIRDILSRGDGRFWTAFEKRSSDREYLPAWLVSGMASWETGTWEMPRDAEEADRMAGTVLVDETLSWLTAAHQLAKSSGVRLVVVLAPVGTVDPAYVDFWRPWPNYYSFSLGADARHRRLAEALRGKGLEFIDLRQELDGKPGIYRLSDGHWTERGTEIVAGILARAVEIGQ